MIGRASPVEEPAAASSCAIEDVDDEDFALQEAIRLSEMEANMTEEQRRKREEEELEQVRTKTGLKCRDTYSEGPKTKHPNFQPFGFQTFKIRTVALRTEWDFKTELA